jgi:hypothetical protein
MREDNALYRLARDTFLPGGVGSWATVLVACGFDPRALGAHRGWVASGDPQAAVVDALRRHVAEHGRAVPIRDPDALGLPSSDSPLYQACCRFHGSVREALRAAGLLDETCRRLDTADQVVDALHAVLAECRLACLATGSTLDTVEQDVIAARPLARATVLRRDPALANAARAVFGRRWADALTAAGLDPARYLGDKDRDERAGRQFELYLQAFFALVAPRLAYQLTVRVRDASGRDRRLRPDFVDAETGTWLDAKLTAGASLAESCATYRAHADRLVFVTLHGGAPSVDQPPTDAGNALAAAAGSGAPGEVLTVNAAVLADLLDPERATGIARALGISRPVAPDASGLAEARRLLAALEELRRCFAVPGATHALRWTPEACSRELCALPADVLAAPHRVRRYLLDTGRGGLVAACARYWGTLAAALHALGLVGGDAPARRAYRRRADVVVEVRAFLDARARLGLSLRWKDCRQANPPLVLAAWSALGRWDDLLRKFGHAA